MKEKITSHLCIGHAEFTHEMLPASECDILRKVGQVWKSPENKHEMIKGVNRAAFIGMSLELPEVCCGESQTTPPYTHILTQTNDSFSVFYEVPH